MRSFRSLLSPRDWLYSLSLLVPLSLYDLGLKSQQISQVGAHGLLATPTLLCSNLFFSVGFGLWWVALLALARRSALRVWVRLLLQAGSLLYAVVLTGAHQYFAVTGASLDYDLIELAFISFGELKPVMASEVSLEGFAVVCGYFLFGPALLTLAAAQFGFLTDSGADSASERLAWCGLLVAVSLMLLALIPVASPLGKSFSRDPFLHLLVTAAQREGDDGTNAPGVSQVFGDATLVRRSPSEARNLVLVILESTGASSVTPYNQAMPTTPYLDELASNSLLVERAYSTVPHTSKALVSIICGIEPRPVRLIAEALPGLIPATCLPELLDGGGYRTVFFQSASEFFQDRRQLVANFGYQDFYPGESMKTRGFERANYFGFEDDVMLAPSRNWLEKNGDGPFFATYLTVTPHHQYLAPQRYGRVDFTEREEHNLYLNTIRYLDFFVKNLISQYQELGLYDDTVFVIVGDHGEAFGEHRRSKHDDVLYEEVMRIPFLIHAPGLFTGGRLSDGPASLLDVLPSAVDLLGFDIEPNHFPGSSVLSLPPERQLFFSCFHENKCLGRLDGFRKFIHYYDNQPDELFDLSADPGERENIADPNGADVRGWRAELREWRAGLEATYKQQHRDQIDLYVSDFRPTIRYPLDAVFAGRLALVGYDLDAKKVKPGESFRITYHFQVLKPLPPTWRLVLEGWPEEGERGDDESVEPENIGHRPLSGLYRLRFWRPGQYVADTQTVTIPRNWPSSSFVVVMGFWNKRRAGWVRVRATEAVEEGRVSVAHISVQKTPTQ